MAQPAFMFNSIGINNLNGVAPSVGSVSLNNDATNAKVAWILRAETANAITHVRFLGWKAGTCPTYVISIQGVDASGDPDGVIKGGGSPASATFSASNGANEIIEVALTNSYTPAVGDQLAVVIEHSSGSVDFDNNLTVAPTFTMATLNPSQFEYADSYSFGTWNKSAAAILLHLKTATERYGGWLPQIPNAASTTMPFKEVTTTGQRVAAKIVIPAMAHIASFKISGFALANALSFGETVKAGIWNAAGTALVTSPTVRFGSTAFEFTTAASVSPGDTVYIGLESVSNSSAKLYHLDFANTTDRDYSVASGSGMIYSEWNGSAWTDSANDVPLIEVFVSEITGAAGGGGSASLVRPGLVQ